MGLYDGRKSFRIGLAVLIQYRSVTDTQPATQPPSHVAVAITLNAQASSLKTIYGSTLGLPPLSNAISRVPFSISNCSKKTHAARCVKRDWSAWCVLPEFAMLVKNSVVYVSSSSKCNCHRNSRQTCQQQRCRLLVTLDLCVFVNVCSRAHSFIHLFCKKQLTERNCTIKLETWLKYYNSSNIQLQIKLQVQIGLTVNVNDLLRMLTGERSIVYRLGWHF